MIVIDRGLGISDEDQKRLFQPFERAESVQDYAGMGLGLFISRQIVESHGGTITLQSKVGQGATFTVSLPLSLEPSQI